MSNKEQVEKDLREYLAKAENLRNADKLAYLKAVFDKHFTFTQLPHVVTRHDLQNIVGDAKGKFTNQPIRPQISGKEVEREDLTKIAIIEAFIGYLNRNQLLKKTVSFDYTDDSNQYETLEE
jgi:hypothetical protein